MLVKWITCEVADRAGFDRGQRAWGALRDVPGFLGQGGGWSVEEPNRAHLFGFWADPTGYRAFMSGPHDRLAAAQAGTYTSIQVRLLTHRLDIGPGVSPGLAGAGLLRVAHCHVHSGRTEHFRSAQRDVWNPGMAAAPGMLGGSFAEAGETEFLVLSLWSSRADHEIYRTDRFADLRRRSGASDDLAAITGELVTVEPHWSMAPERASDLDAMP